MTNNRRKESFMAKVLILIRNVFVCNRSIDKIDIAWDSLGSYLSMTAAYIRLPGCRLTVI
jgi:hypothetical protein